MSSQTANQTAVSRLLGVLCIFLLGSLLTAGLWPFHAPRNQVSWLPEGVGLRFGRHGTLVSSGSFQAPAGSGDAPFSIEIRVEPSPIHDTGTILAFSAPDAARQFSVYQLYTGLVIQSERQKDGSDAGMSRSYVDGVFSPERPSFVTITSSQGQTSVYRDGVVARQFASLPISGRDLAGRLVIANAPKTTDTWTGTLRGVAIYRTKLDPEQVKRHFETWTKTGQPEIGTDDNAAALYLFDERGGNLLHNKIAGQPTLTIPHRFMVVDQYFLEPIWHEYEPTWSYGKAALVNIAGFIPMGFLFLAYFSAAAFPKKPALATILLGFAVSLTIEVTQSWLPTRDSGTTDLFTNTLGTALGVLLYQWAARRESLVKAWAFVASFIPIDWER